MLTCAIHAGDETAASKPVANDANLRGPHLFRYYNPRPSKVEAAEKAMSELIGVKHWLAVNSCTSALVAALSGVGDRRRRRGDRAGVHVLRHGRHGGRQQRHSRDRRRRRHAVSRSRGGRKGDHQADQGHRAGPHARGAGPDGRHSGPRPAQGAPGRRGRGPGRRRLVPGQAAGKPRHARLLQLRLLQGPRQRRGRFCHDQRRVALHPGAELARHGRLLASRSFRPRTQGGRAVLRRKLPDERTAGRGGLGPNPQDRRHAGRLSPAIGGSRTAIEPCPAFRSAACRTRRATRASA